MLMASLRECLTMLVPPSYFYRRRIAEEARSGEPELAVLATLVRRGGTAVDTGANQGVYASPRGYADRVVAFEPNPDYLLRALDAARPRRGPRSSTLKRVRVELCMSRLSDQPWSYTSPGA